MLEQQASLKKEKKEKKEKLKKLAREESPEKGIQTLFRVTLRNHLKLSDIADTKANILLSVNAIIISNIDFFILQHRFNYTIGIGNPSQCY